jgi:hypothetical protein
MPHIGWGAMPAKHHDCNARNGKPHNNGTEWGPENAQVDRDITSRYCIFWNAFCILLEPIFSIFWNAFCPLFGMHFINLLERILSTFWNAFFQLFGTHFGVHGDAEWTLGSTCGPQYFFGQFFLERILSTFWNAFYQSFGTHFVNFLERIFSIFWNAFSDFFLPRFSAHFFSRFFRKYFGSILPYFLGTCGVAFSLWGVHLGIHCGLIL